VTTGKAIADLDARFGGGDLGGPKLGGSRKTAVLPTGILSKGKTTLIRAKRQ